MTQALKIPWSKPLYDYLMEKGFNLNSVIPERVEMMKNDEKAKRQFFEHLLIVFDLSRVSEEESDVLTNLSVLPSDISIEDFRKWMKLESKDVINDLIEKGWLKREVNMVFMHNVIQEVIRYRTSPDAEKCKNLIESLTSKLYLKSGENPIAKQPYLRFAESLLRHIGKGKNDENLANLANNLSTRYWDLGNLPEALKFQLKDIIIKEKVLKPNDPDLATSYNNISSIYKELGDFKHALEYQLEALAIKEKELDMDHPDLAASYNNLAMIYLDLKNYPLALEYEEKSVAISQRSPKGHPKLEKYKQNRENIKMAYSKNGAGV